MVYYQPPGETHLWFWAVACAGRSRRCWPSWRSWIALWATRPVSRSRSHYPCSTPARSWPGWSRNFRARSARWPEHPCHWDCYQRRVERGRPWWGCTSPGRSWTPGSWRVPRWRRIFRLKGSRRGSRSPTFAWPTPGGAPVRHWRVCKDGRLVHGWNPGVS